MGSLHKGHLSLIKIAKNKSKKILVSIYINPSQFNDKKDFLKYPRSLKKDISILKKLKVNYLFLPNDKEIYKQGIKKKIKIAKKDKILCARYRKGHFEGVLAVVYRFMQNINAKFIFLGEKDFQQVYLIKKYLGKKFKTKIINCKTIRFKNSLAYSSRNKLLTKKYLNNGIVISKIIKNFHNKIIKDFSKVKEIKNIRYRISNICSRIEYFEIRNKNNLTTNINKKNFKIFIAYYLGNIRLIDNF